MQKALLCLIYQKLSDSVTSCSVPLSQVISKCCGPIKQQVAPLDPRQQENHTHSQPALYPPECNELHCASRWGRCVFMGSRGAVDIPLRSAWEGAHKLL